MRRTALLLTVLTALAPPALATGIVQVAYLKASNTGSNDRFGQLVAASGETLVVTAPNEASNSKGVNGNESNNNAPDGGAAYVFVHSGSIWLQQAYVKASNTETGDLFGGAIAIDGDTMVIGAGGEDGGVGGVNGNQADTAASCGAAYVFERAGGLWTQTAYLKAGIPEMNDGFGLSVGVSGGTIVVGALSEDSAFGGVNGNEADNSASGAGAAYVFVRTGLGWIPQAYLKANAPGASDAFGTTVAISGDTIVVGGPGEDSNSQGVNGDDANNLAAQSGAAWVFVRNGSTWTQQAYLKASNAAAADAFGGRVAISGSTIVVGTEGEDSDATGVNGSQGFDGAPGSGAAYVFHRSGSSWSPAGYLKASNTGQNDTFGYACAVSGEHIVVGAYREDSDAVGIDGNQLSNLSTDSGAAYVFTLPPAGPWTDMGSGLAGVAGVPGFSGTGTLAGGSNNQLDLANAAPAATAALFIALSSTPTPFKGGTLLPVPTISMLFLGTNGAGAISLPFVMPGGVPAGTQLWMQWAIADTAAVQDVALSNGLRGITP